MVEGMADQLDLRIAGVGAPTVDWTQLGQIPKSYWEGLQQAHQQKMQDLFQSGVPKDENTGLTDYNALFRKSVEAGGTPALAQASTLAGLDLQQRRLLYGAQ